MEEPAPLAAARQATRHRRWHCFCSGTVRCSVRWPRSNTFFDRMDGRPTETQQIVSSGIEPEGGSSLSCIKAGRRWPNGLSSASRRSDLRRSRRSLRRSDAFHRGPAVPRGRCLTRTETTTLGPLDLRGAKPLPGEASGCRPRLLVAGPKKEAGTKVPTSLLLKLQTPGGV